MSSLAEKKQAVLDDLRKELIATYLKGSQDVIDSIREAAMVFPTNTDEYHLIISLVDSLDRIVKSHKVKD